MARGYSNDPRRIQRLKKVKRGQGPLIPPAPARTPQPRPPVPPAPKKAPKEPGS